MRSAYTVPLALLALAGCATPRWPPAPPRTTALSWSNTDATAAYRIACPDVLEVRFAGTPEWDCLVSVDVDGTVPLGPGARVPVGGKTAGEAAEAVARAAGADAAAVTLSVVDPRAGTVSLFGPEQRQQRTVAFRGPEPVSALLRRTGALKPGCFDPRDVWVLRPNVAAGRPAEVFQVDLEAVVLDGDPGTDLVVAAGDQVYVGESRRSSFARLLPTRLKPVYQRVMGMVPDGWPWQRFARSPRRDAE